MKKVFVFLLCCQAFNAYSMFQTSQCVSNSFNGKVNVAKGPFGLFPINMSLKKNRCIITLEHQQVFNKSWEIDLCREPVHIKVKSWSGEDFYLRKSYPCHETQEYCKNIDDLFEVLSNEALIYAKGERETIDTDHGKFFCSYLLLKEYLMEGKVFSLTVPAAINIFEKTPLESFGASDTANASAFPTAAAAGSSAPAPTNESKKEVKF